MSDQQPPAQQSPEEPSCYNKEGADDLPEFEDGKVLNVCRFQNIEGINQMSEESNDAPETAQSPDSSDVSAQDNEEVKANFTVHLIGPVSAGKSTFRDYLEDWVGNESIRDKEIKSVFGGHRVSKEAYDTENKPINHKTPPQFPEPLVVRLKDETKIAFFSYAGEDIYAGAKHAALVEYGEYFKNQRFKDGNIVALFLNPWMANKTIASRSLFSMVTLFLKLTDHKITLECATRQALKFLFKAGEQKLSVGCVADELTNIRKYNDSIGSGAISDAFPNDTEKLRQNLDTLAEHFVSPYQKQKHLYRDTLDEAKDKGCKLIIMLTHTDLCRWIDTVSDSDLRQIVDDYHLEIADSFVIVNRFATYAAVEWVPTEGKTTIEERPGKRTLESDETAKRFWNAVKRLREDIQNEQETKKLTAERNQLITDLNKATARISELENPGLGKFFLTTCFSGVLYLVMLIFTVYVIINSSLEPYWDNNWTHICSWVPISMLLFMFFWGILTYGWHLSKQELRRQNVTHWRKIAVLLGGIVAWRAAKVVLRAGFDVFRWLMTFLPK